MQYLGVIPARYGSTRYPGKPLVMIAGKTMIQRVYEQASRAITRVVVATDDDRIRLHVLSFGGKVVMTSPQHRSGTDRCAEALELVERDYRYTPDVVVNIQGDEPFIQPEQLLLLMQCFENPGTEISTLVKRIEKQEDLFNPNIPKVVLNKQQEALYFSRSTIPYLRGTQPEDWLSKGIWYKHIGIYAYRNTVLKSLSQLEPASPEMAESLEQLRWLWNGYRIKTAETTTENMAVDTPEDLERILETLNLNPQSR